MTAFYSDKVMDHFTHPRNVGEIPDADGIGEIGNAKCGDIMKMYIKVKDGCIADVKFKYSSMMATALGSFRTSRRVLFDVIAITVSPSKDFILNRSCRECALAVNAAFHGIAPGLILEGILTAAVHLDELAIHKVGHGGI